MPYVTVLHCDFDNPQFQSAVALVDVPELDSIDIPEALQYAYRWTQNEMGSWSLKQGPDANHNVRVLALPYEDVEGRKYGLRSTMIGDQLIINGRIFKVAPIGFEEIF